MIRCTTESLLLSPFSFFPQHLFSITIICPSHWLMVSCFPPLQLSLHWTSSVSPTEIQRSSLSAVMEVNGTPTEYWPLWLMFGNLHCPYKNIATRNAYVSCDVSSQCKQQTDKNKKLLILRQCQDKGTDKTVYKASVCKRKCAGGAG